MARAVKSAFWLFTSGLLAFFAAPIARGEIPFEPAGCKDAFARHRILIALKKEDPSLPQTRRRLEKFLKDKNPGLRMMALGGLGDFYPSDPKIQNKIAKALFDEDKAVQERAADVLGEIKAQSPQAIRLLEKKLLEKDLPALSLSSMIEALGETGPFSPKALIKLKKLLSHKSWHVRAAAERALKKFKEKPPFSESL